MKKIWWALRCLICEELIDVALRIAPKDYTPSVVQAIIDAQAITRD